MINQPTARDIFVWPVDVRAALRGRVCFSDRATSERSGQKNSWINKNEKVFEERMGAGLEASELFFLFSIVWLWTLTRV